MNSSTSAITVSQLFALHIELHYWNITITNTESTEAQMYKKSAYPQHLLYSSDILIISVSHITAKL